MVGMEYLSRFGQLIQSDSNCAQCAPNLTHSPNPIRSKTIHFLVRPTISIEFRRFFSCKPKEEKQTIHHVNVRESLLVIHSFCSENESQNAHGNIFQLQLYIARTPVNFMDNEFRVVYFWSVKLILYYFTFYLDRLDVVQK